jgi:hypothetical protein
MPQRDQHNASDLQSQAPSSAEQCWDELVAQRLPANLETQARVLGAFQRVRELASAQDLLRALLCYVLSLSSLKHLSGWSRLVGVTSKVRIAPGMAQTPPAVRSLVALALHADVGSALERRVPADAAAHSAGGCDPSGGDGTQGRHLEPALCLRLGDRPTGLGAGQ